MSEEERDRELAAIRARDARREQAAVLWHDVTVNDPRNADVRGMPMARVRARCRLHPAAYTLFNSLLVLRTHVLACIEKPL